MKYNSISVVQNPKYKIITSIQLGKKVMSNSPGLVDFAIGLVHSFLNITCLRGRGSLLGNSNFRRVLFNPAYQKNFFKLVKKTLGLVHASYRLPE